MSTIVYKVVMHGEHCEHPSNHYCSSATRGDATLTYKIGEKTENDTPIFVFLNKKDAIKFLHEFVPDQRFMYTVLEGYVSKESRPFSLLRIKLRLPFIHNYSRAEVRRFWNSRVSCETIIEVQPDWYGVYDFTPLREVRDE